MTLAMRGAFEQEALHRRVELERDTASLRKLGERHGKLVAVAGLVTGKMQSARQLDGCSAQRGLDRNHSLAHRQCDERRRTQRARAPISPRPRAPPWCGRVAARRPCRDRRRCRYPRAAPRGTPCCNGRCAACAPCCARSAPALQLRRNAMSQRHCCGSSRGRKANGACGLNSRRATLSGMPGAAQGPANPGQMPPALAKLVSSAGPSGGRAPTSWPALAR